MMDRSEPKRARHMPSLITTTDASAARLFFPRQESAAENGAHAEDVEVIGSGQSAINALGLVGAGKGHEIVVVSQEAGEALRMLAEIQVVKIRERRAGVFGPFSPHHRDQIAGVGCSRNRG